MLCVFGRDSSEASGCSKDVAGGMEGWIKKTAGLSCTVVNDGTVMNSVTKLPSIYSLVITPSPLE